MTVAPHRLASLDACRGVAVAAMILINNPGDWGSVYAPLQHASWNGVHVADFVFPGFVFILGVALPFGLARYSGPGLARRASYRRILQRAVLLFALGLILNATTVSSSLTGIRLPGVLQRIAIAYLVTAILMLHTKARTRGLITMALLLAHWAVLTLVPFDGHSGGLATPEQNISASIDRWLFGVHRMTPVDPEGALGTLSTIAVALLGTFAGDWIRVAPDRRPRVRGLAFGGVVLVVLGLAWSLWLPLNKPLWTGSFALVTAGASAILLTVFYVAVDVQGLARWVRPFTWLGLNPLAIYFLSELVGHMLDRSWVPVSGGYTTARGRLFWGVVEPIVGGALGPAATSLLLAVGFTAIWIAVARELHRQGLALRV